MVADYYNAARLETNFVTRISDSRIVVDAAVRAPKELS